MFEYEGSRGEFIKLLADFGEEPAFIRRASAVENRFRMLVRQCELQREKLLKWPKVHLVNLRHRIGGNWSRLLPMTKRSRDVQILEQYNQTWTNLPTSPSQRPWTEDAALRAFIDSAKRFNSAWRVFLDQVDVQAVNESRRLYNEYYPIERECAFGNATNLKPFEPMQMVERDDLLDKFPLLELPQLRR